MEFGTFDAGYILASKAAAKAESLNPKPYNNAATSPLDPKP